MAQYGGMSGRHHVHDTDENNEYHEQVLKEAREKIEIITTTTKQVVEVGAKGTRVRADYKPEIFFIG